jgi:hypothetical protein
MSNKSKIGIPKTCQENWLEMNPDEKIRFCNLCQKNIFLLEVDYSKFDVNICTRYNLELKSASQKRTTFDKISDFILKMRTK